MKPIDKRFYIISTCTLIGVCIIGYILLKNQEGIFYTENSEEIPTLPCSSDTSTQKVRSKRDFTGGFAPNGGARSNIEKSGGVAEGHDVGFLLYCGERPQEVRSNIENYTAPTGSSSQSNQGNVNISNTNNLESEFSSMPNYTGETYDESNMLNIKYDSTTSLPTLYLGTNYTITNIIIFLMMFIYDYYYVLELSDNTNSEVNDETRLLFQNYLVALPNNFISFITSNMTIFYNIYSKINIDLLLQPDNISTLNKYIIAQITPIVTYINVHSFIIGLIKSAYNGNHNAEFESNFQNMVDNLVSSKVSTMNGTKEGFVGSSIFPYTSYTFSFSPLIEAYESTMSIPSSYNRTTMLPFLKVNGVSTTGANNQITNPTVFYYEYTINELIKYVIFILYDFKCIMRETSGNGIEDLRNSSKTRDDNYRKGHAEIAKNLYLFQIETIQRVIIQIWNILRKNNRFGAIPSNQDLDDIRKSITAVINNCILNMNIVIDALNYVKENWKNIDTLDQASGNTATYNKIYVSTYQDRNDGGIKALLNKILQQP